MNIDRVLIVRKPYARWIVQGLKQWELRSTQTNVRGRIGIAESGTRKIIGEVDLVDALPALDEESAIQNQHMHKVEDISLIAKWRYPWVLSNALEYAHPVDFKHKTGAVIWVKLN